MKTTVEMAKEAGVELTVDPTEPGGRVFAECWLDELERFAALVAAAKEAEHKEAMRWDVHSCGPTCKRYACVAKREAVAAEREACAKVCETTAPSQINGYECADAIRARSQA